MASAIYPQPDDTVASISAQVQAARDEEVELIVSGRPEYLRNALRLRLLERRAKECGKRLVLVTSDGDLRGLARSEGWATRRPKSTQSPPQGSPLPARVPIWQRYRRWQLAFALAFPLAALAALGGLFVPSATVTITPRTEPLAKDFGVIATRDADKIEYAEGRIPAQSLELDLDVEEVMETTGTKTVPDHRASGKLTLVNRGTDKMKVPESTKVATADGVEFAVLKTVEVPGGNGSRAEAQIAAIEAGSRGNVRALAITKILAPEFSSRLGVLNESAIEGGSDRTLRFATPEDEQTVRQRALDRLRSEGASRMLEEKDADQSVYMNTLNVAVDKEKLKRVMEGDEEVKLSLRLEASVTALAFRADDVNRYASHHLASERGEGYQVVPGTFSVRPLECRLVSDRWFAFSIHAEGQVMPPINESRLRSHLAGKSKSDAREYISGQLELESPAKIETHPTIMPRLPLLSWAIDIRLSSEPEPERERP